MRLLLADPRKSTCRPRAKLILICFALRELVAMAAMAAAQSSQSAHLWRVPHRIEQDIAYRTGINLTLAAKDIVAGLPIDRITLVYDGTIDARFQRLLAVTLHRAEIMTKSYSISSPKLMDEYTVQVRQTMAKYEGMTSLIFCSRKSAEELLGTIRTANLIQRNMLYMFHLDLWPPSAKFVDTLLEAMRVAVISSPRPGTYRVYYTQATAEGATGTGLLKLVNWWSTDTTLFRYPVLPPASRVYTDLRGRTLHVPVLHKPPWNFVTYTNKTFLVEGGRDHELLSVLADKLHFQFQYFDPPERSQGSAFVETTGRNKSFPGILGLISERRADLALGDITITHERSQAVEFSFLTLADSGAFVTKTPSRLNEALALVRPFQREVWPVLVLTILLSGPLLFGVLQAPRLWRGKAWVARSRRHARRRRPPVSDAKLFWNAVWLSIALFFRQSVRAPEESHRVRVLTILLSFAATYVIGDMYSANLTSLLARPGRERPISNLEELAEAMETRGYQLLVEKHSSSYNILENGTGVYERLWGLMRRQRNEGEVESGEDGMLRVGSEPKLAMLGGRETLYFDARRFGAFRFHLSEKLFTRYSAIALQIGCPYIESINSILMQLFEAGILTKMTEEEYEKLGDKLHEQGPLLPPERPPVRSDASDAGDEPEDVDDDGSGDASGWDNSGGEEAMVTVGDRVGDAAAVEAQGSRADYATENSGEDEEDEEDQYVDSGGEGCGYDERDDYQGSCRWGGWGPTTPQSTGTSTLSTTTPMPVTLSPGVAAAGPGEGADAERKSGGSSDEKLKPISIKMLQGAFYALLAGYLLAAAALGLEVSAMRLKHADCSCRRVSERLAQRPCLRRCVLATRSNCTACWARARGHARRVGVHAKERLALLLQRTDTEEEATTPPATPSLGSPIKYIRPFIN